MAHGEPGLVPGELGEELVQVAGPLHGARAVATVQQQHRVLLAAT